MAAVVSRCGMKGGSRPGGLRESLNGRRHSLSLRLFMVVVLGHWAEHLAQALQIYALGWPVPEARGVLGLWFPWLVKSEALHYSYALVMLFGLWLLREGFGGASSKWWAAALILQFWHHIEHGLLILQAAAGQNLFGAPVPTSVLQLLIPRVELHLFYNTVVFVPMVVGMYLHVLPAVDGRPAGHCSCVWKNSAEPARAV